jgi:CelD/BcsL family acetyltransferase involved in cellulose biosynthesis
MAEPSRLGVSALPLVEAASLWDAFAPDDCFGIAQSLHWVECWAQKVNPEIFCGVVFEGDAPILILPLELVREKTCRVARFIGGSHANANFPMLRKDRASAVTAEIANALFNALFLAVPKLDAVILARQQPQIAGIANPFAALPSQPSPNLALSFAMEQSFEHLIKHAPAGAAHGRARRLGMRRGAG